MQSVIIGSSLRVCDGKWGAPRRSAKASRLPILRPSGLAPPGGPAFFAYSTNYLVDVRYGVIVDVEATSAHRTKEVDATRTMIDRVERRFKIKPKQIGRAS